MPLLQKKTNEPVPAACANFPVPAVTFHWIVNPIVWQGLFVDPFGLCRLKWTLIVFAGRKVLLSVAEPFHKQSPGAADMVPVSELWCKNVAVPEPSKLNAPP